MRGEEFENDPQAWEATAKLANLYPSLLVKIVQLIFVEAEKIFDMSKFPQTDEGVFGPLLRMQFKRCRSTEGSGAFHTPYTAGRLLQQAQLQTVAPTRSHRQAGAAAAMPCCLSHRPVDRVTRWYRDLGGLAHDARICCHGGWASDRVPNALA